MQFGQTVIGDFEAHGGGAGEVVEVGPINDLAAADVVGQGLGTCPAQNGLEASINANDAEGSPNPRELNIIDAHNAMAGDVNNLVVEHIVAEQHLVIAAAERLKVHEGRVELGDAVEIAQLCGGDEEALPTGAYDETRNGRVGRFINMDHQIVKLAKRDVGLAANWAAQELREQSHRILLAMMSAVADTKNPRATGTGGEETARRHAASEVRRQQAAITPHARKAWREQPIGNAHPAPWVMV